MICFNSFSQRDAFVRIMETMHCNETNMDGFIISTCLTFRLCVPRVQGGGKRTLVRNLNRHALLLQCTVYMYDPTMEDTCTDNVVCVTNVCHLAPLLQNARGDQVSALQTLLTEHTSPHASDDDEVAFSSRFLQSSIQIEAADHGTLTITNLPPGLVLVDKSQDWNTILHAQGEVAQESDKNRCIACNVNRASICFINCDHQCLCDVCVRKVKSCPICRAPLGRIVRPRIIGVE